MVNLRAAGALERCETLPHEIDLDAIEALDLSEYSESYFARENLRALEKSGSSPDLAAALRTAIGKGAAIIAHSGYKEENLMKLQRAKKRLTNRNEHLQRRVSNLTRQKQRRRYQIADRAMEGFRRVPGSAKLLKLVNRFLLQVLKF